MVRYSLLVLTALTLPAGAQSPGLSVELNAAEDVAGACRVSFLAVNSLGADLSALVFEAVLINRQGQVDRLAMLDFADLPQGRTRVRQFDLAGLACADLGRVILNAAGTCAGDGLGPDACMAGLSVISRLPGTEISG